MVHTLIQYLTHCDCEYQATNWSHNRQLHLAQFHSKLVTKPELVLGSFNVG